jgi:hypothetical protein
MTDIAHRAMRRKITTPKPIASLVPIRILAGAVMIFIGKRTRQQMATIGDVARSFE